MFLRCLVGAVGIEIASLKLKSSNRKGVAPPPPFQLLAFVGGSQESVFLDLFAASWTRPARADWQTAVKRSSVASRYGTLRNVFRCR